jgi:hypothetical protein
MNFGAVALSADTAVFAAPAKQQAGLLSAPISVVDQ